MRVPAAPSGTAAALYVTKRRWLLLALGTNLMFSFSPRERALQEEAKEQRTRSASEL